MKKMKNRTLSKIIIFLLAISTAVSMSGISSYAASSDTTVYITKTGKCYHNSGCSSLSKSCIETTLGEASGKYSPCSKCKPPVLDNDSSTTTTTKSATTSKASTSAKNSTKSSTKSSTSSSKSSTSSSKSSTSKSNKTTSKSSTSKKTSSSADTTSKQTSSSTDTTEKTVWVPTNGGTKYHSKSTCSNMKDPVQLSLDEAENKGYTPCKKCH